MNALGLIEVIGYPCAVDAADAAAKSANIKVLGISKVGSGIMTVQLSGDVGAINSAVQAGAASAAKVGTVLHTHVIPRADSQIVEKGIIKSPDTPATSSGGLWDKSNAELKEMLVQKGGTDEKQIKYLKKEELIQLLEQGKDETDGAKG